MTNEQNHSALELAILKQLLRDEIAHAAFNGHLLDPSSQGWEPGVPVVRSAFIEGCIEGAARRVYHEVSATEVQSKERADEDA